MTTTQPIRAISYGGGVQSTALLVLAAQRRIDYPLFLMANVGEDSEHPATLDYVRDIAAPYAEQHGIELVMLDRIKRDGSTETLMKRLLDPKDCRPCRGTGLLPVDPEVKLGPAWRHVREHGTDEPTRDCEPCAGTGKVESRSLPIPVRMSNGAPGNRSCTADFKIKVIGRELKRRGASADNPATIGIGISLDEIQRANSRHVEPYERVVYPLVGVGEETGLKLRRDDCSRIIREAGIPVPPKSSCYFCPFHKPEAWADLARDHPDLWEKSVELEDTLNRRRDRLGKDHVYLTRFGVPLREAIDTDQQLLPLAGDDGACDSGWCFT